VAIEFFWPRGTWRNYRVIQEGMTEQQVIALIGDCGEEAGKRRVFVMNRPHSIEVRVRRWWSKLWNGRIDVGFDEAGRVQWKQYYPRDRNRSWDSIRDY
jgi:hypothetical protein